MYETTDKMVSHPAHYMSETGLEVIDVLEAFTSDLKGIEAVDTANALKYLCRWSKKNGIQDLEKAMWYIQHLIDHLKNIDAKKESDNVPEWVKNMDEAFGDMVKILTGIDIDKKESK